MAVRRRASRTLATGSAISTLGSAGMGVASPLLVLFMTRSPILTGLTVAAGLIPPFLLGPLAAAMADRVDPRRSLVMIHMARILTSQTLGIAFLLVEEPVWPLIIATFLNACWECFRTAAEAEALRQFIPQDVFPEALARSEIYPKVMAIPGRVLGGVLLSLNAALPVLFDAVTSLASLAITLRLSRTGVRRASLPHRPGRSSRASLPGAATLDGLRIIGRDPFLGAAAIACSTAVFLVQAVPLLLLDTAVRQTMPPALIGVLFALPAVAGVAGWLAAPRIHQILPERSFLLACFLTWAPLLFVVSGTLRQPLTAMLAWAMCNFVGTQINVVLAVHRIASVRPERLGRVMRADRLLTAGATALGSLIAGYAVAGFGPRMTAHIAAGGTFAIAVLLAVFFLASRFLGNRSAVSAVALVPSVVRARWRSGQGEGGFIVVGRLWRRASVPRASSMVGGRAAADTPAVRASPL
ncbi:MFS transporter [Actinomadura graeca]|uniref:MFS transporter n=1 Tax=Actinomadura graeca TaxID=2750812 RepID=A0ABX8QWZ8_9ACTN|nr:MFS transporter [Actinomadura graeca]QXJ21293.1 MFS transporter [Actinomadura graeca]